MRKEIGREEATHGRIFRNPEAMRAAVAAFVERHNTTWRLEKSNIMHRSRRARSTRDAKRRSVNLCPRNRVGYSC